MGGGKGGGGGGSPIPAPTLQVMMTQPLHGLAPKCKLIDVNELVEMSKSNNVTLLPFKNGENMHIEG